jgi:hypothetical protein
MELGEDIAASRASCTIIEDPHSNQIEMACGPEARGWLVQAVV